MCFEICLQSRNVSQSVYTNPTIGNLAIVRASQIKVWNEKRIEQPPLFAWQQQLVSNGMFEAYTYWLLKDGRPDEHAEWVKNHGDEYGNFLKWRADHPFQAGGGLEPWPAVSSSLPPPENPGLVTEPRKLWALATCALLTEVNHDHHNRLGGMEPTDLNIWRQKENFARWWGVKNKDDLRDTLSWLYRAGHREQFEILGGTVASLLPGDLSRLMKRVANDPEKLNQISSVSRNYRALGDKGIIAWDLDRYVALCGWGSMCYYLTDEEAWQRIMPVARRLQKTFGSWEELGQNHIIGREFWSYKQTQSSGRECRDAFKKLCEDPASPWRTVPWNTDLGTNTTDELEAIKSDRKYDKRLLLEEDAKE